MPSLIDKRREGLEFHAFIGKRKFIEIQARNGLEDLAGHYFDDYLCIVSLSKMYRSSRSPSFSCKWYGNRNLIYYGKDVWKGEQWRNTPICGDFRPNFYGRDMFYWNCS